MQDRINQSVENNKNEMWLTILIRYVFLHRGIRLSFIGACLLLGWDMALTGSYLLSFLACPIWLIVSVIKNAYQRPGWIVAIIRIAIPPMILWLVMVNDTYQCSIAEENATRIIRACEQFHADNGKYPKVLDDLTPEYLPFVPRAKYCLDGKFRYWNECEQPMLVWTVVPPYGRKIYNFQNHRWGYID